MIPQNILDKLSTSEGIAELSRLLVNKDNTLLNNASVFYGATTEANLSLIFDTTVKATEDNKSLVFDVEIPPYVTISSINAIKLVISPEDFMHIQQAMHKAMSKSGER